MKLQGLDGLQSPFYLTGFGNLPSQKASQHWQTLQSPFYLTGFGNTWFTIPTEEFIAVAIAILPNWLRQPFQAVKPSPKDRLQSPFYLNGFGNLVKRWRRLKLKKVAIAILPTWLRQPFERFVKTYDEMLLQSPFYLNGFGNHWLTRMLLCWWTVALAILAKWLRQPSFHYGYRRRFIVAIAILPKWLRQLIKEVNPLLLPYLLQSPFYLNGFGNLLFETV